MASSHRCQRKAPIRCTGPLDQILDLNVRDGLVYYRALDSERGPLDRYVASLNVPAAAYEAWSREQKMAFWLNAYNAFVLQTVINHYPIRGKSAEYPESSIRQIPGAFEPARHRAAGRSVTLDEIEKTILPEFKEPRLFLALGRGAVGSGRLRSEAYTAATARRSSSTTSRAEFVREEHMITDRPRRRDDVGHAHPELARGGVRRRLRHRSAAGPSRRGRRSSARSSRSSRRTCCRSRRSSSSRTEFRVVFHQFDWRLNDLTGGSRADASRGNHAMDLGLTDKVAIITGSSRGLGLASARALVPRAAASAICARGAEQLAEAALEVEASRQRPSMVAAVQADVSTPAGVELVIERAVETFGGLDILVNNVGRAGGCDICSATTDAEWQAAFDETLFPAIRASRLAVPHMKARGGGAIMMIASIYGREAGGRMTYNAVKAAEISLAKALAAAAGADRTSASTASPPARSCFPAARGTSASRPIPTASPSSSAASCRSAASGGPRKSPPSSRSSPPPRASWISGASHRRRRVPGAVEYLD